MTTRVSLIRHGETDWNVQGRFQGLARIPLNDNGIAQARAAGEALRAAGITRIIASDLARARQTAEHINAALNLPIEPDPRWREVDVGDWQGMDFSEIERYDPANYDAFFNGPYIERAFPNGESQREHIARTADALDDTLTRFSGEHVLVVTHGGCIRCAMYYVSQHNTSVGAGNCSVTRFYHNGHSANWQVAGVSQPPASIDWTE